MAFGFTPKFEQSLDLNGLNPEHYLVIALDAAKQLDWTITNVTKTGFTAYTGFSMRSWNEEVNVIINEDTVQLQSRCLGNQIMDWGKNKDNLESLIAESEKVQSSLTDDQINDRIAKITSERELASSDMPNESPGTSLGKAQGFFSLFKPWNGYFITPIIVYLNLLVFILMVLSGVSAFEPDSSSLIMWGADFRPLTLDGQWWRLFTSIFLHIGLIHILMNMYALIYIGLLLEPYLGKLRFASAYLFTGLISSISSIYWHPNTISAGASGAIFGMYGVFLAMLTTNIIDKKTRSALFTSIGIFVVFNLMNGANAGIDNAAHIGGLVSGLLIGYAYYPSLKTPNLKYLTVGLLLVATTIASFCIYHNIPEDGLTKYEKAMKDFSQNEAIALQVFNGNKHTGQEMLSDIKDKGIANWNKGLKIVESTDKLDIPQELKDRNSKIKQYCQLQIVKYGLLYKAVEQNNTLQYDNSIDSCNTAINGILKSLKGKKDD
jgi:rhomboid protease GluP